MILQQTPQETVILALVLAVWKKMHVIMILMLLLQQIESGSPVKAVWNKMHVIMIQLLLYQQIVIGNPVMDVQIQKHLIMILQLHSIMDLVKTLHLVAHLIQIVMLQY